MFHGLIGCKRTTLYDYCYKVSSHAPRADACVAAQARGLESRTASYDVHRDASTVLICPATWFCSPDSAGMCGSLSSTFLDQNAFSPPGADQVGPWIGINSASCMVHSLQAQPVQCRHILCMLTRPALSVPGRSVRHSEICAKRPHVRQNRQNFEVSIVSESSTGNKLLKQLPFGQPLPFM